jgi:hypothetical protein
MTVGKVSQGAALVNWSGEVSDRGSGLGFGSGLMENAVLNGIDVKLSRSVKVYHGELCCLLLIEIGGVCHGWWNAANASDGCE